MPVEHRACLAACAMSYNFDVPRLRGDCPRRDFTVKDFKKSLSFSYLRDLSDETLVVYANETMCIFAFRGTQFNSPERFLGLPADAVLSPEEQELTPNERAQILMQYCPSNSGVGCSKTTTSAPGVLPAEVPEVMSTLTGGLVIDSGSDCIADSAITHRREHLSRLHQLCADRYDELAKLFRKNKVKLFATGHSLGGNLAAFSVANSSIKANLVLFTAGAGPEGAITGIVENLFSLCQNKRKNLDERPAEAKVFPKKKSYKELPRTEDAWAKNTIMYREACDVVSAYGISWWPTISFLFRRNETSYCEILPRKTDSHSLANYVPNDLYIQWCPGIEDLPRDESKDVSGFEGQPDDLKDYGL